MTPLQRHIQNKGHLIKTAELHAFGVGRTGIERALAAGEIQRIRQSWYANPWLPVEQARAARIGGQLACGSAAGTLGMWEPLVPAFHVCVDADARALRSPSSYRTRLKATPNVVVHWTGIDPGGTRTVVSVGRCLAQLARCAPPEVALVVAESALNRGRIGLDEWWAVLDQLPRAVRRHLGSASGASDSGTESVFVYRMARLGVLVQQQVAIEGVGRVDGLIGERLVIELDSKAFHLDPTADRHRDAVLSALGYRVLRFMYSQVMQSWPEVEAAVLAAIGRGDHLAA
jgi:very-short-patch-repair endonuclease